MYASEFESVPIMSSTTFFSFKIKEIDKGLLKFVNLVELILTVNQIESCNSVFLPSGLQVLDLSGNQISDLGELVKRPLMELQHLGLAYNHISDLKNYLDPVYW
jgi:Leucine-rich repeat (LRR) protein